MFKQKWKFFNSLLEGIVAKRWDSVYESRQRSGVWQKYKTQRTADFLVGGYIGTDRVEELVIGELRNSQLHYVDSVRNG